MGLRVRVGARARARARIRARARARARASEHMSCSAVISSISAQPAGAAPDPG